MRCHRAHRQNRAAPHKHRDLIERGVDRHRLPPLHGLIGPVVDPRPLGERHGAGARAVSKHGGDEKRLAEQIRVLNAVQALVVRIRKEERADEGHARAVVLPGERVHVRHQSIPEADHLPHNAFDPVPEPPRLRWMIGAVRAHRRREHPVLHPARVELRRGRVPGEAAEVRPVQAEAGKADVQQERHLRPQPFERAAHVAAPERGVVALCPGRGRAGEVEDALVIAPVVPPFVEQLCPEVIVDVVHLVAGAEVVLHVRGMPLRLSQVRPEPGHLRAHERRMLAPPPVSRRRVRHVQQRHVTLVTRPPVLHHVGRAVRSASDEVAVEGRLEQPGRTGNVRLGNVHGLHAPLVEILDHLEGGGKRLSVPPKIAHVLEPVEVQNDTVDRNVPAPKGVHHAAGRCLRFVSKLRLDVAQRPLRRHRLPPREPRIVSELVGNALRREHVVRDLAARRGILGAGRIGRPEHKASRVRVVHEEAVPARRGEKGHVDFHRHLRLAVAVVRLVLHSNRIAAEPERNPLAGAVHPRVGLEGKSDRPCRIAGDESGIDFCEKLLSLLIRKSEPHGPLLDGDGQLPGAHPEGLRAFVNRRAEIRVRRPNDRERAVGRVPVGHPVDPHNRGAVKGHPCRGSVPLHRNGGPVGPVLHVVSHRRRPL